MIDALKRIAQQQVSIVRARAIGTPILVAWCVMGIMGCSNEYPKSQPEMKDLAGIWEGRFTGTASPPSVVPTLQLRADGTFTGSNLAGLQMRSDRVLSYGEGSWRIRPMGSSWDLEFNFRKLDGVAANMFWSAKIVGRQPPYRVKYGWDDPDLGQFVVFSRTR